MSPARFLIQDSRFFESKYIWIRETQEMNPENI